MRRAIHSALGGLDLRAFAPPVSRPVVVVKTSELLTLTAKCKGPPLTVRRRETTVRFRMWDGGEIEIPVPDVEWGER